MLFERDYNPDTGNLRSLVQISDAVKYGLEGEPLTDAAIDGRPEVRSVNPEKYRVDFGELLTRRAYRVEAHSWQEAERMAQELHGHGMAERATLITQPLGILKFTCDADKQRWIDAEPSADRRRLLRANWPVGERGNA